MFSNMSQKHENVCATGFSTCGNEEQFSVSLPGNSDRVPVCFVILENLRVLYVTQMDLLTMLPQVT